MRSRVLAIVCCWCIHALATDIKITPDSSLADAVRQARELRRTGKADQVTIQLAPGTYHLYEPLRLRPEDSGLTIEGKDAIISGGQEINVRKTQGNLCTADIPDFNGRPVDFRQLWIYSLQTSTNWDGFMKAVRARDVMDFEQMYRILNYDKKNQTLWVPKAAVEKIMKAPYAEMVLHEMWCTSNLRIKSLTPHGDSVAVRFHDPEAKLQFDHPWPSPMTPDTGHPSPFYLTNAKELLDSPGEWYHDYRAGKLYYYPHDREETVTAIYPVVETLIEVIGTADRPVRDITIKGVTFSHTTWMRPTEKGHVPLQAGMYLTEAYKLRPQIDRQNNHKLDNQGWLGRADAAVEVRYGENISFEGCRFEHLGGSGLDYVIGCKGGTVSGCKFIDIAMNGLVVGSFSPEGLETHLPYRPTDNRDVCSGQIIEQSEFCDVSNEDWGCVAIAAGYVSDITIAHNTIHDVSYTGISLGWGWNRDSVCMKNNKIHANLIYNYAQHTYDCAGIYTLGNQPGTVISENVVRDIAKPSYVHDPNHWFYLYTDEGSSNITLRDNWTPKEKFLKNANGPGNVWENNGPQVSESIKHNAGMARKLTVKTRNDATNREIYAAEYLQKKLAGREFDDYSITLKLATEPKGLAAEGYRITTGENCSITIEGHDPSGVIYGAVELAERLLAHRLAIGQIEESPQMVMRGTCIGLQKTTYLPGHAVYEYPYTPENFPWFYDKEQWIRYLDMMVENKFNSLYLWNGHPFASLVRLNDYPFAVEVDDATFRKNEEIFTFLTHEADRRGIWVIQMFYNIILSKPFADHYGLKTQDRNRPITPLIADYTRKSIAAFIKKYPNVGLLVCLGEAMATVDDDVKWMKETIIPGIKDGLAASGDKPVAVIQQQTGQLPPIVLRSHDTDGPLVLKESLPLYPNIYTMSKYTGESLTTYEPGGPWGDTHRQLADAAPVHIDNVHILANLEPWRWSSPAFIAKTVQAMQRAHHSKGLHLYPQASYWDWPYTADKLPNGERLLQIDRDWMWYKAWGRYAWSNRSHNEDDNYWSYILADYYGISRKSAAYLLAAYNEAGEIAPKLLRRFGITEGNRQTLLLGMTMAQLVNPYKFNIYPGFYESCGPEGEKLIEYVEKEQKGEQHVGELPLDIVDQCLRHGMNAVEEMTRAMRETPTRHVDEWQRVWQDIWCYNKFAMSFRWKVKAAEQVLRYKWKKDVKYLEAAVPLLEKSLEQWRHLSSKTDSTYLYANSMQTAQRRIPVGGDNGKMKTWSEMLPVYEAELEALKTNIEKLKHPMAQTGEKTLPSTPASITILSPRSPHLVPLGKNAILFENRPDTPVDSLAPELVGLQALMLNRDTTRIVGTSVTFDTDKPVKMLVGFFQDDDPKWAKAPKLEVDATGNEYGQAEPILTNAITLLQMPPVNIHAYHFPAGHHTINLPKGIILVAGFTSDDIKPRDVGLQGAGNEVDWLFNSTQESMQHIYDEVRTPYKYGLVVAPMDNYHKIDCPTVFREGDTWYMTYVCYDGKDGTDGRGYETWLAKSDDLLHWQTLGRILAFPEAGTSHWDQNQRGGFPALIDYNWGGTYEMRPYKGRYYLTYIGGAGTGYEAVNAPLSIGMASTAQDITKAHPWDTQDKPLMSYNDKDAQWWEQLTQYKSTIYDDPQKTLGKRFVMFYNAGGKDDTHPKGERIGIALSNDMKKWTRFKGNPVFAHNSDGTITGDAQIVRMGDLWVMFYFSAFNPTREYNAYNTFAVSRDLVHWQDWDGPDLISPSKPYDKMFAHKSYVLKHDGVVYHFYCAVNNDGQRGIALATSRHLGKSEVNFPEPEPAGHRYIQSLNEHWTVQVTGRDSVATAVNIPINLDDYYGAVQKEHGNLHGEAVFRKTFTAPALIGKQYFLRFEGVGTYADITLNGHHLGRYDIGRTTETIDITSSIKTGQDNELVVVVSHPSGITDMPWVCGGCSSEWGFSEGSQPFGIFRPVVLEATDPVRVEPFGVHVWNNASCDSLFIDTEIKNYSSEAAHIEFISKLCEKSGKQVIRLTQNIELKAGETKVVRQSSALDNPKLWSTTKPYLYNLNTIIKRNGKATESVNTPYGISAPSWPLTRNDGDQRFLLNGTPLFINGVCEYEHEFGQSHAFSHPQIEARVKMVKDAGFNAFRDAHQPHNLYYQEQLNREGILWWPQFSAHIWYDTPEFRASFKRHLRQWVKERRNSPSIILWGLQNESTLPKDFAEECCAIIREMDPRCGSQRLITTCNGGEGTDWNVVQNWSGTYGGDLLNYGNELKSPQQLLNGEYGAWRTIGNHTGENYTEELFCEILKKKILLAESVRDSICGQFLWLLTSHDNPGRRQPDEALRRIDKVGPFNYKGLFSIWDQPTDAYYMYQQHYNPQPIAPATSLVDERCLAPANGWRYLYRLNCGGDDYTDRHGSLWMQDNSRWSRSWAGYKASQTFNDSISSPLFQTSRFGRHKLSYHFPAEPGRYRVELYFIEPWYRQYDAEGLRLFDVAINDSTVVRDLDIWAQAHYGQPYKRVVEFDNHDKEITISFPRVNAGQAVISAIAIASKEETPLTSHLSPFASKPLWSDFERDILVQTPDSLLPPRTTNAIEVEGKRMKNRMEWTFNVGVAKVHAIRWKYYNPDAPRQLHVTITDNKGIVYKDAEVTFLQTQQKKTKRKMTSITTGSQVNAGQYKVVLTGNGLNDMIFDNLTIE